MVEVGPLLGRSKARGNGVAEKGLPGELKARMCLG